MPLECQKSTSGGKGNVGMFIERDPKICAAGVPSAQATEQVGDHLCHYLLQDEADALISDAIFPPKKPRPLPPLRKPMHPDMRNAFYGQVGQLIGPPMKTKFQTLVDDLKETAYSSYWKVPLGKVRDPVPMLPEGMDVIETCFGKKNKYDSLYDIVMPKIPLPDKTPNSKKAGVQTDRNYCKPPFDRDLTYGHRSNVDNRGILVKCCLTDPYVEQGLGQRVTFSSVQSNYLDRSQPRLATCLTPNNNISYLPEGHAFGKKLTNQVSLPQSLTFCDLNPDKAFLKKCLGHLNTLRKVLSKRYLPTFFRQSYLNLKYYDTEKTGWLKKDIVYNYCASKLIRFNASLIEPLLSMWEAFDGENINYEIFVRVINYREPSPEIPKIEDVSPECLYYTTTYREMVKPNQEIDPGRMAGVPSGRYFDRDYPITPKNCCNAHNINLPEESDAKTCLCPSILIKMNVTHRDMYVPRDKESIKRIFEGAGEKFTDESFESAWSEAQKHHSEGLVCIETFRRAWDGNVNV